MGRHTTAPGRRIPGWLALATTAAVAALVAVIGVPFLRVDQQADAAGRCVPTSTVRLVVAPDVAEVVDRTLEQPVAYGGRCTRAVSRVLEPAQAAAALAALDPSSRPHLWIPDSSLWLTRAGATPVRATSALAASPVVLATSREAAADLGWVVAAPTWGQALTSGRPLAVPDLSVSAEGILSLAAGRAGLGGGREADRVVVEAALAAEAGDVPSAAQAMAAAAQGGSSAALVPMSERDVLVTNRAREGSRLLAVYPTDGSPSLNYPLVRVGTPASEVVAAVDAVVRRLTSPESRQLVRRAGFRDAAGLAPIGAGSPTGVQEPAPATIAMDPLVIRDMADRLIALKKPSRILTVIDVSTSMGASAGGGRTRVDLARDATVSALTALPDQSSVGLWVFASELDGATDHRELAPPRPLTADVEGVPQRQLLLAHLADLPSLLSPGGTSLNDSTLAAVRSTRASFDPSAVNSVVVITDGRNEDSTGMQLEELVATLRAEHSRHLPVQITAVGLGPDVDEAALQRIAEATGGQAYQAADPHDLQAVLFDALLRRRAG